MTRLSPPVRRTLVCVAGMLAAAAVLAEGNAGGATSGSLTESGTPIDRVIFALGVLLVLSQAMERVIALAMKGLLCIPWIAAQAAKPAQEGALHPFRVLASLLLAFFSGVSTLDLLNTGAIKFVYATDGKMAWLGLLLTGLICSMGSAFLTQLLELLKALKEVQQQKRGLLGKMQEDVAVTRDIIVV